MTLTEIAQAIMGYIPSGRGSEGLMPAEHLALLLLLEEQQGMSVSSIGAYLKISQASASELVTSAEKRRRVTKVRSLVDRRVTLVHISNKGAQELRRSRAWRHAK